MRAADCCTRSQPASKTTKTSVSVSGVVESTRSTCSTTTALTATVTATSVCLLCSASSHFPIFTPVGLFDERFKQFSNRTLVGTWADSTSAFQFNYKVLSNQIALRRRPIEIEVLQVAFLQQQSVAALLCAVKKENLLGIANIWIAACLLIRTLTQMRNCCEARV